MKIEDFLEGPGQNLQTWPRHLAPEGLTYVLVRKCLNFMFWKFIIDGAGGYENKHKNDEIPLENKRKMKDTV